MSAWIAGTLCIILLHLATSTLCDESAGKGEIFPSSTRPPQECRACPPGQGVTRICDIQEDTQCASCPEGTFNSKPTKDSSCQACSSCPEDYYVWTPCSFVLNTVCESCRQKPSGSGNEDYLRKCERTTTTVKTTISSTHVSSTKTGGGIEDNGGDLEGFITKGQGSTLPGEGGDGSGEGSGEIEPPLDTKTVYSSSIPTAPDESTDGNVAGPVYLDENQAVSEASFAGWPILVAALVAALICFIVGLIIGIILKRRRKELSKEKSTLNDPEVHIAMVPNGKEASLGSPISAERTPIYTGNTENDMT